MYRNSIIILAIIIFVLLGITVYNIQKDSSTPVNEQTDEQVEATINQRITEFGSKLKNVSLLMSPADVKVQMELHYGEYLTPELLAVWQNDLTQALGRNVSSPWPDHIDIIEITKLDDTLYRVEGNVIEITSTDTPEEPAAVYPVTITLVNSNNMWLIAETEKGSYAESQRKINVKGLLECLPHKSGDDPQTLECALGVAIDQSDAHYALDLELLPNTDFPISTHVQVDGVLLPPNEHNSFMWNLYPIDGIIQVKSMNQI